MKGRSIVVSKVTTLSAGWSGVRILLGVRLFSSQNIRLVLEPTQPPIPLVSEEISPGWGWGDWLQHDIHHTCLALRLRMSGTIPLLPSPGLHFVDRDNFTITVCFVVNCVRSLIPKIMVFSYNFMTLPTPVPNQPLASKLTQ